MRRKMLICSMLFLVVPGLLLIASCATPPEPPEPEPDPGPSLAEQEEMARQAAEEERRREEERLQRQEEARIQEERRQERLRAEEAERQRLAAEQRFVDNDIHFEFDSSVLLPMAEEILREKAQWLEDNPDRSVIIEGHCDERGTNEYNLALGDRRAESAKGYLINLGVRESRLTSISYGEERPLDPGSNEEAWAKNRRAHFEIE